MRDGLNKPAVIKAALVEGRHKIADLGPHDGAVFPYIDNVFAFGQMADDASAWLHDQVRDDPGLWVMRIYVTGLSQALVAFLDAWVLFTLDPEHSDRQLVLMHYDRETDRYVGQVWGRS